MPAEILEFDRALGEQGYRAHEAAAMGLEAARLSPFGADPRKLAMVALGVSDAIERQGMSEAFEKLGRASNVDYDIRHKEDLPALAWGLWHAHESRESAATATTGGQIPPELALQAQTLKSAMTKVLGYHLSDDPQVAAELAVIRSGRGYLDLASDLSRLANLYRDHKAAIESDTRHYDPTHEIQARAHAAAIIEHLSINEEKIWIDRALRMWTLLETAYSEVHAAAQFLFRGRPDLLTHFPSLVGAARRL